MTFRLCLAASVLAAGLSALAGGAMAETKPINIVVIGDSNTLGWFVGSAYPEQLEAKLKAKGYHVSVKNGGILGDSTSGMLSRIEETAPEGTRLVIVNPGGNDLRYSGTKQQRAKNVQAMVNRMHAHHIPVIIFDPVIQPKYLQSDGIHVTAEGHAKMASELLGRVEGAIGPRSAAVVAPAHVAEPAATPVSAPTSEPAEKAASPAPATTGSTK
jgi:acyl-CoA thioesterase-1